MFLIRLFFSSLPFLRKYSHTFMTDGATRYNTSTKNRTMYWLFIVVCFSITGLIFYGYRQYDHVAKQNMEMTKQLNSLKHSISYNPAVEAVVLQSRELMQRNKELSDEIILLRDKNIQLSYKLSQLERTAEELEKCKGK